MPVTITAPAMPVDLADQFAAQVRRRLLRRIGQRERLDRVLAAGER